MCLEENSITLGQCVYGCNGNDHCEEDCLYRNRFNPLKTVRQPWPAQRTRPAVWTFLLESTKRFKMNQLECPCEGKCIEGCPCDGYDCKPPTTMPPTTLPPDQKAALVLSTYDGRNKPVVINFAGETHDIEFEFGENTAVAFGCGATFLGEFWYFGGNGSARRRQVSFNGPSKMCLIKLRYSRWAKSSVAKWFGKKEIWLLISLMVHVIHLMSQHHEFCYVLMTNMTECATRKLKEWDHRTINRRSWYVRR